MRASGLEKMFSIGLSLEMSVADYRSLLDEYGAYVYDVYFSLPLGAVHHSRLHVREEFARPGAEKHLLGILALLKERGIKLEVALNTAGLDSDHVEDGLSYVARRLEPDSVVTLARFGLRVRQVFPAADLVYSYNNGVRRLADVDGVPAVFDEIVLGNAAIRNLRMFAYAKAKGLRTKLLLNNGCSFNCGWCRQGSQCRPTFERNLRHRSAEELYALQSLFPWEVHRHMLGTGLVDRLKISSRPSSLAYLTKCLASYLGGGERELVAEDPGHYHLWGRLAHFQAYYETFDYDRITDLKEAIWRRSSAPRDGGPRER